MLQRASVFAVRTGGSVVGRAVLLPALLVVILPSLEVLGQNKLNYSITWVGNSFPGRQNKWVQNFFIYTAVQADGTVNTWSHWDEGGKRFGVYREGDVVGNEDVKANSLETRDQAGRLWKIDVRYTDPQLLAQSANRWEIHPSQFHITHSHQGEQLTAQDARRQDH